jgi:hypothetical protein
MRWKHGAKNIFISDPETGLAGSAWNGYSGQSTRRVVNQRDEGYFGISINEIHPPDLLMLDA